MALLSSSQAAHRLGVKVETLYAYVSRGVLTRHLGTDHRTSWFDADAIEQLARRGRPRAASRANTLAVDIATAITSTTGHDLRYRGLRAADLARSATFEQVAELLWLGSLPSSPPVWEGRVIPVDGATMRSRLVVATAHAAASATTTTDVGDRMLDAEHVAAAGRDLIATLVDSLPTRSAAVAPRLRLAGDVCSGTIAGRLWTRLTHRRCAPTQLAALNGALVLLTDHELAASTLAARVTASTRAAPWAVVAAGLGAVSGRLHGGESVQVRALFEAAELAGPEAAIDEVLGRAGRLPGFGQVMYPNGDPRAPVLLSLVDEGWPDHPSRALHHDVAVAATQRGAAPPNIDFALAALGDVADWSPDVGEGIFALARTAGWLAHAIEEYQERPLRFRPRATYVGP